MKGHLQLYSCSRWCVVTGDAIRPLLNDKHSSTQLHRPTSNSLMTRSPARAARARTRRLRSAAATCHSIGSPRAAPLLTKVHERQVIFFPCEHCTNGHDATVLANPNYLRRFLRTTTFRLAKERAKGCMVTVVHVTKQPVSQANSIYTE